VTISLRQTRLSLIPSSIPVEENGDENGVRLGPLDASTDLVADLAHRFYGVARHFPALAFFTPCVGVLSIPVEENGDEIS